MQHKTLLIICMIFTLALSCNAYAVNSSVDSMSIEQPITYQTKEELKESREKEKEAKKLYKAITDYKNSKISKKDLDALIKKYKNKYSAKKDMDLSISDTSDIVNLNYTCYRQETSYYCGPASAYIVLKGMGVSSNPVDGRTLSQNNLASDLGTTTNGTGFPGTWADTMNGQTPVFLLQLGHPIIHFPNGKRITFFTRMLQSQ